MTESCLENASVEYTGLGCQRINSLALILHRYDRVVDVCSLRTDLKILPYGDQTEVGALPHTLSYQNWLLFLMHFNHFLSVRE